ncbi:MAG: uracil-DNA glycosylase family protein [Actinomycetota bacterium]
MKRGRADTSTTSGSPARDERDERQTIQRTALRDMYAARAITPADDGFGCPSLKRCAGSVALPLNTGNWAFVGCDYGLARVGGMPAKVLFIAMDRGGRRKKAETFTDTQRSFRSSIETPKNPHMGGVSLIVRELVDEKDLSAISGQCALTNAVKCAQQTGSMSTDASRLMVRECVSHLRAEIAVLAPDIIVTQGSHPASTVLGLYESTSRVLDSSASVNGVMDLWTVPGGPVVLRTPHPARQKGVQWSRGLLPQDWRDAISAVRGAFVAKQGSLRDGLA